MDKQRGFELVMIAIILIAVGLVAASVIAEFKSWEESLRQDGRNEIQQKWDKQEIERKNEALRTEREWQGRILAAQQQRDKTNAMLQSTISDNRGLNDKLQQLTDAAMQRASGDSATPPDREAVRALGDVFGECKKRFAEMGAAADAAVQEGRQAERSYEALILKLSKDELHV